MASRNRVGSTGEGRRTIEPTSGEAQCPHASSAGIDQHDSEREAKRAKRPGQADGKERRACGRGDGAVRPGADAATFTVNTLADSNDNDCADNDCSLREAAYEANQDAAADTITFASGLTGTIRLSDSDGDIPLYAETTVTGPGADVLAVSGQNLYRIFYVNAENVGDTYDPVTISGLTLKNGYDSSNGGALYSENTTLTLQDMVFDDNEAGGTGGAVYSDDGNLTVANSPFTNNVADNGGGALYVADTEDTAADDDVEVSISGSTFRGNFADGQGGGVNLTGTGDVVIENTTLSGNEADGNGGALYMHSDAVLDVTVRSSTISDNTAEYGGGAHFVDNEGTTLIENTTISGNEAFYDGGGVYFGFLYEDQTTTIRNSTIVDNVAGLDPGEYGDYAGGGVFLYDDSEDTTAPIEENGPVNISSTIIANNTADSGNDLGNGEFADGFIVGFSLAESNSGATIVESPAGSNIFGTDPLLGPLQNDGGQTQTPPAGDREPRVDAGTSNGLRQRPARPAQESDLAIGRQPRPASTAPTSARPSSRPATSRPPARAGSGES